MGSTGATILMTYAGCDLLVLVHSVGVRFCRLLRSVLKCERQGRNAGTCLVSYCSCFLLLPGTL